MNENYLSVKEFAAAAGVTTQYIYKILGSSLKPYKKKINKKIYIEAAAVEYIKGGFLNDAENQPKPTENQPSLQPNGEADLQQNQPTDQPTNATNATDKELKELQNGGEVEALKLLVEELKQDKEDLKKDKEQLIKDKEDLKQEALKWQQLLLDERNKVKLLEEAAAPVEAAEFTEVKEAAAAAEEIEQSQEKQELPKTFREKLRWLLSNK